ncbi:hypothetical protein DFH11DRAFT_1687732 [Phellopilus nigrolimitatus]|nr:hypothetical protein DFH11DRAFT_1687732 [Phellopilus nigrolimitatus]
MAAIYAVYTSPSHTPIPNHLPTLIVTPHGQPTNILYSYLHTNFNAENYLLTPSPQGDLCVAKLFPPRREASTKASASDPGHGSAGAPRVWSITNTGISKPNPNAGFWSMFYFAYAGHNIPPKRIEFGKIQKNPPGPTGGGTRISITGKSPEEKAVWQTLGEGNEDCVEWVVLCAALNLLDDEILKAAEKNIGAGPPIGGPRPRPGGAPPPSMQGGPGPGPGHHPHPHAPPPQGRGLPPGAPGPGGMPNGMSPGGRGPPPGAGPMGGMPMPGHGIPMGMPPGSMGMPPGPGMGRGYPPPGGPGGGFPPPPGQGYMSPGPGPQGFHGALPPQQRGPMAGPPPRRF